MRRKVISALLVIGSGMLLAQSAPIKMGLWEKTVATSGGVGGARTMKARSCVTADAWKEMVANAAKPRAGCTNNSTKTATGYSFSVSCTMNHGDSMSIKGTTTIQDSEHIVSDSHTTMMIHGQTHDSTMHATSHFVSASCGAVKPGQPEIEEK